MGFAHRGKLFLHHVLGHELGRGGQVVGARLGHAIAQDKLDALIPELLHDVDGGGGRPGHDPAQAGQVRVLEFAALHHHAENRGRAEETGRALPLDDLQRLLGIVNPAQVELSACVEQRQGEQVPAPGVKQGQQDNGAVAVAQAPGADLIEGIEQLAAVAHQAALGQSGGAAGVDDEVNILQLQCVAGHQRVRLPGQELVVRRMALLALASQHYEGLHRTRPLQRRRVGCKHILVKEHLRALPLHELPQLLGGQPGVIGHQNGPQLSGGVIGVDEFHPVPGQEGHPSPLATPQASFK